MNLDAGDSAVLVAKSLDNADGYTGHCLLTATCRHDPGKLDAAGSANKAKG